MSIDLLDIAPAVTVAQMLTARDLRADHEAAALKRYKRPLIALTVVMPGSIKDGWVPQRVMTVALEALETACRRGEWRVLSRDVRWPATGPEALYVVDADSVTLKAMAFGLEEHHPLGRLWDLDVIETTGERLSRRNVGLPARRCLLCGRAAHVCARSRRHPLRDLRRTIRTMVQAYDCRRVT